MIKICKRVRPITAVKNEVWEWFLPSRDSYIIYIYILYTHTYYIYICSKWYVWWSNTYYRQKYKLVYEYMELLCTEHCRVKTRSNIVKYNNQNSDQTSYSQWTLHSSPCQASYGAFVVRIFKIIYNDTAMYFGNLSAKGSFFVIVRNLSRFPLENNGEMYQ